MMCGVAKAAVVRHAYPSQWSISANVETWSLVGHADFSLRRGPGGVVVGGDHLLVAGGSTKALGG